MKSKWAAELRKWRQTRKSAYDAEDFMRREHERLKLLLKKSGRIEDIRDLSISDIDNELCFALADELVESSEAE